MNTAIQQHYDSPPGVTSDDVQWAYRTFLRRLPDSTDIVNYWIDASPTLRELVEGITGSAEYKMIMGLPSGDQRQRRMLFHRTRFGTLHPVNIADPMDYKAFVELDYEAAESDAIFSLVGPGDTVVDVGARQGWFTGIMAQKAGPSGRVFAIDPDPAFDHVGLLQEANQFRNITFIQKGASDREATVSFDQSIAAMGQGPLSIEVERLDRMLARRPAPVRVMKMDIEGAEYLALKGAHDILTKDRPKLLVEISNEQLRRVSGVSTRDLFDMFAGIAYRPHHLDQTQVTDAQASAMTESRDIFNLLFLPS